ncbi:MAG: hypothetical protein HY473_00770 [Candidatus Sungbacteria bacterium]|uniref:Heat-inducible transcription repressor HrcA n=1 Tax=Candidatus Sungiibacteriota bacterium TaxID=2750080 RepID=A0A932YXE5_9BACT|nr:hypothetical protein [Candidatus Sungbacteria bacterium]
MPVELTERQKSILDALIREYVATAEPVASEYIVRKYRLPYSPATVRNELVALDEAGFLAQPHTSAGRVPTDKGYRFFINHREARSGAMPSREERAMRELSRLGDPAEFMKQSSRLIAHLTRNFVVAGFPDEELFYKSGISEVLREPEFSDFELLREFSTLVDKIEDEIARWFGALEFDGPRTFIGSENPIRQARHYGMIISSLETPFARESMIALVGPKRMDYGHNLAVLTHFQEALMR